MLLSVAEKNKTKKIKKKSMARISHLLKSFMKMNFSKDSRWSQKSLNIKKQPLMKR